MSCLREAETSKDRRSPEELFACSMSALRSGEEGGDCILSWVLTDGITRAHMLSVASKEPEV